MKRKTLPELMYLRMRLRSFETLAIGLIFILESVPQELTPRVLSKTLKTAAGQANVLWRKLHCEIAALKAEENAKP